MRVLIFLSLCVFFYFGCQQNRKTKAFSGDRQFQTTDPSRLYFKNIRSINYYQTRKPNTKIDIYQHRKFSRTDKRPILYPMILDNWLTGEAYLFIEKNAYPKFAEPLLIQAQKDTVINTFKIEVFNKKNQYRFAEQLYNALNDGQELTVKTKTGAFVPIFQNYQDKSNFRMTISDYFRLIEQERKDKKSD